MFGALLLASLSFTAPAHAVEKIDQGNIVGSPSPETYTQSRSFSEPGGQTFRAGETGLLTRIALIPQCGRCASITAEVVFRVRAVAEGQHPHEGAVISEEQDTVSFTGARHDIVFGEPGSVTAGQVYAIEIPTLNGLSYSFLGTSDTYGIGSFYAASTGYDTTFDLAFLTYVTVPDSPPETTAPAAPAAPSVTVSSPGRVFVSWEAVPMASGYRVFRSKTASGTYMEVASSAETTGVVIDGHGPGRTHFYKVQAINSIGSSPMSVATSYTAPHPAGH